jgi:hypothetical protein
MDKISFVDRKDFASFGFFFEDGLSGKIQIDIFGRLEIVLILYSVDDLFVSKNHCLGYPKTLIHLG